MLKKLEVKIIMNLIRIQFSQNSSRIWNRNQLKLIPCMNYNFFSFKGPVSITSSHSQCKDGNAWLTTVPLNDLSDQIWKKMYFQNVHFHLRFLSKSDLLAHFLQIKSNGEIHSKNNYYPSQQNDVIFHIFDHIKVSSVALKIRHCHLSIKITFTPPL